MKILRWKTAAYLAVALLLAFMLKNAGSFLVINQQPKKADVIVVLSGGIGARTQRGIQLYRRGFARYLLFTCAPTNEPKVEAVLEGVPEQVILLDNKAQNTYQNAVYSKALMEQYNLRSAIVISSDYDMRRVSLIFPYVFRGTHTKFTYVAVKTPGFHPAHWWTSGQTILELCYQYAGIVVLYLGLGNYLTDSRVRHSPLWLFFRRIHLK